MKNIDALGNINRLADNNRLDEALVEADKLVAAEPENGEALFVRGKLLWRIGERHRAMGDYARAAAIDPDGPASMALEQAQVIDAFYNRDLYNP